MEYKKTNIIKGKIKIHTIVAIIFLALLIAIIYSISQMQTLQDNQSSQELTDAISRSCVHAYANTGAYPESIEELERTYGINIDETKYVVHYEIFASNIMPEITVIAKNER